MAMPLSDTFATKRRKRKRCFLHWRMVDIALITFQRIGKTGFIKTCSIICSSVRRKMMLLVFYMDIFATRNLSASVCLLAKTVLGQLDTLSEMVLHKLFFSVLAIRWLVLMSYTYRIFEFCTG